MPVVNPDETALSRDMRTPKRSRGATGRRRDDSLYWIWLTRFVVVVTLGAAVIALYTHFQLRDDTPSGSSRQSGGRRDWARATADAQGVADGEADDGEAEAPDPADPIYSFALITDVQYADIPDGKGALGSPRHYKYSLDIVNNAVKDWRADDSLSFGIHVGDIVDMKAKNTTLGSLGHLRRILGAFKRFGMQFYYVLGNHCLSNFNYEEAIRYYEMTKNDYLPPGSRSAYYTFSPASGQRVVVIDAYDWSVLGRTAGDSGLAEATAWLAERNTNENKRNPFLLDGRERNRRYTELGGALGKEQMKWLERTLQQAESARETVVVFSHVPAHPDSTSRECADACLIWNFDEVLQILRRHKSVVRVFFAGHDHFGGYARDQGSGIHFVTLQGVIETALNDNAYATVEVFRDRVLVNGKGRQASYLLLFEEEEQQGVQNGEQAGRENSEASSPRLSPPRRSQQ